MTWSVDVLMLVGKTLKWWCWNPPFVAIKKMVDLEINLEININLIPILFHHCWIICVFPVQVLLNLEINLNP